MQYLIVEGEFPIPLGGDSTTNTANNFFNIRLLPRVTFLHGMIPAVEP